MTTATATKLRPELPRVPSMMRGLPVHRGYPVPWFVAWVEGEPDFRIADGRKMAEAITERRCWLCGGRLPKGDRLAFTVGPMCAVNRISSEPPQHEECARFAVQACPFLVRPHMDRRDAGKPEGHAEPAGHMIRRNPGVSLIWITRSYRVVQTERGLLFSMGRPVKAECWREGRAATSEEIRESVDTGLPALQAAAEEEGGGAMMRLLHQVDAARRLLGIAP